MWIHLVIRYHSLYRNLDGLGDCVNIVDLLLFCRPLTPARQVIMRLSYLSEWIMTDTVGSVFNSI